MPFNFVARVFRASIHSERELAGYIATVTALCVALALAVDVTNQLAFFVDWTACLRSWAITAFLSLALAAPIARAIGKAHLELYRAKLRADALSLTDPLTGLPNRRALMEAAAVAAPDLLALVIFDIDRFKGVNDAYGHMAGDAVLRSLGQMMAAELGPFGCVARVGGEEFALLSAGISPAALATHLIAFCDRVRSTSVLANGLSVRVTISAGVALHEQGGSFEELYSEADRALYAAKAAGRNQIHFPPAFEATLSKIGAKTGAPERQPLARSA
ncbi:MAG: GGDEF domain-containing protein [Roseiarcus sp.]|jgi:diguanylate cyclase (GGDEF)-like protein